MAYHYVSMLGFNLTMFGKEAPGDALMNWIIIAGKNIACSVPSHYEF